MSILIDFYAGQGDRIGKAIDAHEYDALEDRQMVVAHADFSLHLPGSTIALESFSKAAAETVGGGPTSLERSLVRKVSDPSEEEYSADVVSREWVQMVGCLRPEQVDGFIRRWFALLAVDEEDPELAGIDPSVQKELRAAILDLVALCRLAWHQPADVVFSWSL